jgi:predicted nuclease of predicted toxin-antitoxin system
MKIIIDVNLAVRWAQMLGTYGIEAVHWSEVGRGSSSDTAIMAYARQNGFSVFTNDLDFSTILATTGAVGPSVIQIRAEDTRPEAYLDLVANAILKNTAAIEQGAVITINPVKTRLHILPFVFSDDTE